MLAIPVKENRSEALIVSDLYGNVPFFALTDGKTLEVVENEGCGNGIETAEFLLKKGVTDTLYIHMGSGPFETLYKGGIRVFCLGKEVPSFDDALTRFNAGKLPQVTPENSETLLDPGMPSGNCECGCEN